MGRERARFRGDALWLVLVPVRELVVASEIRQTESVQPICAWRTASVWSARRAVQ
jgi:hypothetical protein